MVVSILISTIIIAYITLVIIFWVGWERLNPLDPELEFYPKVSIVLAVRNEANNIANLITDLQNQEYPETNLELVIVDDHSTDNTVSIIDGLKGSTDLPIKCISLQDRTGKKAAIALAIEESHGEIVLTTDGDCRLASTWLQTMVLPFQDKTVNLVSGPVNLGPQATIFSRMQSTEFSSLIGSGAATIAFNLPTMANAANMAIRMSAYREINIDSGRKKSSGDDIFLLHEMARQFKKSVVFCKETEAVVTTAPAFNLKDFFNQRKRWAGKWTAYNNVPTLLLAVFIFLVNLTVISAPILAFYNIVTWLLVANLIVAKLLFEFWFLKEVQKFFNNRLMLSEFIILAVIYPFYVVFTALVGTLSGYKWKERSLR